MMSLEDGLLQVTAAAAPPLVRQDFGRNADDDDTFCGTGTVDGEVKRGKLQIKSNSNNSNNGRFARPNPFGRTTAVDPFGGKSAFGGNNKHDDSDSSSEEDVDFFAGASNPFKDLKKKTPSKRTVL